jgi:hypothetical protein
MSADLGQMGPDARLRSLTTGLPLVLLTRLALPLIPPTRLFYYVGPVPRSGRPSQLGECAKCCGLGEFRGIDLQQRKCPEFR